MTLRAPDPGSLSDRLYGALRDVPDFPKPGIMFKDITPLLGNAWLFRDLVAAMAAPWKRSGVTHVAGVESRGFILAAPIALALGTGFIPIRKPGKLPWRTSSVSYALEYGTDSLEMHADACSSGSRVLLVDDVLATGGTAEAAVSLISGTGAVVAGCGFLLAISSLKGTARLTGLEVQTLLDRR